MDKTYVFSNEPSSGCCGSKLDITALLPNLMGGRSLDPNLLLALNNGYRNQDMWGGAGMWWMRIMKNQGKIIKETSWLINMMSDDMNIHDFYLLKHYVISRIDKSKRAKREKTIRNR